MKKLYVFLAVVVLAALSYFGYGIAVGSKTQPPAPTYTNTTNSPYQTSSSSTQNNAKPTVDTTIRAS